MNHLLSAIYISFYRISDILKKLAELIEDDQDFVTLTEYPEEDGSPSFLSFDVPEEFSYDAPDYESIDACDPEDIGSSEISIVSAEDLCPNLLFSYYELESLQLSLKNSIEYLETLIDDPKYSKDEKYKLKSVIIDCRNLLPKFERFFKRHIL